MMLRRTKSVSKVSVKTLTPELAKEERDKRLKIGVCSQTGKNHDNEDRVATAVNLNSFITGFVGIFDGHGGSGCSEYMSQIMEDALKETFTSEDDWLNGEEILIDMFHKLEERWVKLARENNDYSGSCATIVVLKDQEALVANIGDCRAVVCTANDVVNITEDHRADAPAEGRRICVAGGEVRNGRVHNLHPSRSFGDVDVKDIVGEGVVIPTPFVDRISLADKDAFIIVASDGLWDTVQNKPAAKCVRSIFKKQVDPKKAAEQLVQMAVKNHSQDDVTVAVLCW